MKTITIFALIAVSVVVSSTTSSHFVRHNIREQTYRARTFLARNNLTQVYVFDTSGYFTESIAQVYNLTIFKENNGSYAVLNPSAQACFRTSNTYKQYSDAFLRTDSIGLYVDTPVDLL